MSADRKLSFICQHWQYIAVELLSWGYCFLYAGNTWPNVVVFVQLTTCTYATGKAQLINASRDSTVTVQPISMWGHESLFIVGTSYSELSTNCCHTATNDNLSLPLSGLTAHTLQTIPQPCVTSRLYTIYIYVYIYIYIVLFMSYTEYSDKPYNYRILWQWNKWSLPRLKILVIRLFSLFCYFELILTMHHK